TLWATHLIDEVAETDTVIVLHRGKVLAQGIAADIVRTAGARDIKDAFSRLTGTAVTGGS
ncbi:MAG: ABC transporter ATP-binding protein, partial [Rhodomicrobium sp.]